MCAKRKTGNLSHEKPIWDIMNGLFMNDGLDYKKGVAGVEIPVGGKWIQLDGAVEKRKLVFEIESGTAKKIRAAIMDLLLHPLPKKLLIIRPINVDKDKIKDHCEAVFKERAHPGERCAVVLLPEVEKNATDTKLIREGLGRLGIKL